MEKNVIKKIIYSFIIVIICIYIILYVIQKRNDQYNEKFKNHIDYSKLQLNHRYGAKVNFEISTLDTEGLINEIIDNNITKSNKITILYNQIEYTSIDEIEEFKKQININEKYLVETKYYNDNYFGLYKIKKIEFICKYSSYKYLCDIDIFESGIAMQKDTNQILEIITKIKDYEKNNNNISIRIKYLNEEFEPIHSYEKLIQIFEQKSKDNKYNFIIQENSNYLLIEIIEE